MKCNSKEQVFCSVDFGANGPTVFVPVTDKLDLKKSSFRDILDYLVENKDSFEVKVRKEETKEHRITNLIKETLDYSELFHMTAIVDKNFWRTKYKTVLDDCASRKFEADHRPSDYLRYEEHDGKKYKVLKLNLSAYRR